MSKMYERISFMMRIADTAAAHATLSPDKTYYSFATPDSVEEGELAAADPDFDAFCTRLLNCFNAGVSTPQSIDPVRFQVFVNNRAMVPVILSPDTLQAFIDVLSRAQDEFAFLDGFAQAARQ